MEKRCSQSPWGSEEMAYAEKVVSLFAAGSIPNLPTGLMIGRLLADLTNSSPVRISKRIPGDRAFHMSEYRHRVTDTSEAWVELKDLEMAFHDAVDGPGCLTCSLCGTSGLETPLEKKIRSEAALRSKLATETEAARIYAHLFGFQTPLDNFDFGYQARAEAAEAALHAATAALDASRRLLHEQTQQPSADAVRAAARRAALLDDEALHDLTAAAHELSSGLAALNSERAARRDAASAESRRCVVCQDADKSTTFVPCGHRCACEACAVSLMTASQQPLCPVCRTAATTTIRVYI